MNLKNRISTNITNFPGWRTNRKIIVFESDDWGSIRMPSKKVFNELLSTGINVDKCAYNSYDSLESFDDLNCLYEVLLKFKDKKGNCPVFTANTVIGNPDFERIRLSGFKEYFFEPFTDTIKRNSSQSNNLKLWKKGIEEKIFYPQFHGREHVNVSLWLRLLQENNVLFHKLFSMGMWGVGPEVLMVSKLHIQASYDCNDKNEIIKHSEMINEGLNQFFNIFGFKSRSFIANNYIWDKSLNCILAQNGVSYIQGMRFQKMPLFNREKRKLILHYTGEKNNYGQYYMIRNCSFEPTENPYLDNISLCLNQINNAFFWKKPAVISTHRLNYIGSIVEENRTKNLLLLKELIFKIIKIWPDVEFLTTVELGDIISMEKNNL